MLKAFYATVPNYIVLFSNFRALLQPNLVMFFHNFYSSIQPCQLLCTVNMSLKQCTNFRISTLVSLLSSRLFHSGLEIVKLKHTYSTFTNLKTERENAYTQVIVLLTIPTIHNICRINKSIASMHKPFELGHLTRRIFSLCSVETNFSNLNTTFTSHGNLQGQLLNMECI